MECRRGLVKRSLGALPVRQVVQNADFSKVHWDILGLGLGHCTLNCTLYSVQSSGVETGLHTASLQSLTAKIQLPAILTSRLYQVTPMKHECGAACTPTPSFESVTSINKASHTFIYMALAIKECSRATWSLRGFKTALKGTAPQQDFYQTCSNS